MVKAKITVAGIGPGGETDITPAVIKAIGEADVVVGYKYYFQFIGKYVKDGCKCIDTGMKRERDRARQAFDMALQGQDVVVISSGDAAIYGMAPLIYEMKRQYADAGIEVSSLPGISAFQKAASLLGAPVGFVHVCESKHAVKVFRNVPKIIIEGRKGGSNLAATLVNSILAWDDAKQLTPGRVV